MGTFSEHGPGNHPAETVGDWVRVAKLTELQSLGRIVLRHDTEGFSVPLGQEPWSGPPVVVVALGNRVYAAQNACPHAGGALHTGEIEDIEVPSPRVRDGTTADTERLACIACPAHSHVFELSTGHCLTDKETTPARVYATKVDGNGFVCISRSAVEPSGTRVSTINALPKGTVDAIQLQMVATALERKFPSRDGACMATAGKKVADKKMVLHISGGGSGEAEPSIRGTSPETNRRVRSPDARVTFAVPPVTVQRQRSSSSLGDSPDAQPGAVDVSLAYARGADDGGDLRPPRGEWQLEDWVGQGGACIIYGGTVGLVAASLALLPPPVGLWRLLRAGDRN